MGSLARSRAGGEGCRKHQWQGRWAGGGPLLPTSGGFADARRRKWGSPPSTARGGLPASSPARPGPGRVRREGDPTAISAISSGANVTLMARVL